MSEFEKKRDHVILLAKSVVHGAEYLSYVYDQLNDALVAYMQEANKESAAQLLRELADQLESGGAVGEPEEEPGEDQTGKPGPHMWVLNKYGELDFPWPVIENPHGTTIALWEVIDDEATVFLPSMITPKPVFDVNSGLKLTNRRSFWGYRKVLSGEECDGEPHVCTLDPRDGAVPRRKVALVGVLDEIGNLIEEDEDD